MKLNKITFLIFLLSIIFIQSCKNTTPIKIGYVAGLTGFMSELGVSGRKGLDLGIDKINHTGGINGRKILLITRDDENTSEGGLKAVKELEKEGVTAIIGHMTSGANKLSFDYINKNKILMISPTVSSIYFADKDDYYFRIITHNNHMGKALADFSYNKGKRKIAVIYELKNKLYTEPVYKNFQTRFQKLGGKITFIKTFTSGKNIKYLEFTREIIHSGADGILAVISGLDCALLAQQLQKENSNLDIFAAPWSMTPEVITNGGKAAERINFLSVFDKDNKSLEYIEFKEKHLQAYKTEPSFSAVHAYDALNVLAEAMRKSKNLNADEIKQSILNIKKFKGLQNEFIINQYGDVDRPYYFFTIRNGEFVKSKP